MHVILSCLLESVFLLRGSEAIKTKEMHQIVLVADEQLHYKTSQQPFAFKMRLREYLQIKFSISLIKEIHKNETTFNYYLQ